jgi:hypothetical protein
MKVLVLFFKKETIGLILGKELLGNLYFNYTEVCEYIYL